MRKIGLFWYGIFIGSGSLQAKGNQENAEKIGQVDEVTSMLVTDGNNTNRTKKSRQNIDSVTDN